MATDLIQQSDVDEQEKQQSAAKPKYNQFSALQNGFQQNQSAVANKPIKNSFVVGGQQDVTNTQNAKNAATTTQGQTTANNLTTAANGFGDNGFQTYNFGVNPTNTALDNTPTPVTGDPNSSKALADAYGASQQDYANRLTSEQNKANTNLAQIGTTESGYQNDLANLTDSLNKQSTAAQTAKGLADVDSSNNLENQSATTNNILGDSNVSGVAKLAALFGRNYDASKYGAQDSQIYGQQLADLSDQAAKSNQAAAQASKGKTTALQDYQNRIAAAKDTVGTTLDAKAAAIADQANQARNSTHAQLDMATKRYDPQQLTEQYNNKLAQAAADAQKQTAAASLSKVLPAGPTTPEEQDVQTARQSLTNLFGKVGAKPTMTTIKPYYQR